MASQRLNPITAQQFYDLGRLLLDLGRAADGDAPPLKWDLLARKHRVAMLGRHGLMLVTKDGAAVHSHQVRRGARPVARGEASRPARWESLFLLGVQTRPARKKGVGRG